MLDEQTSPITGRPILGWASVALGIALFSFILVAAFLIRGLHLTHVPAQSIGASAGGGRPWVIWVVIGMMGAGLISAVAGLLRGERTRWVHMAGVVLAFAAPLTALRILQLLFQ